MVCDRAACRNSSHCCHGAAQHPRSTLSRHCAFHSNRLWLSPAPRAQPKPTALLPSPARLWCPGSFSPPSFHPHQTLTVSPAKQMRSEEAGVSEDGHAGHAALATDTRELKRSESARHQRLTPHCSPVPVTHKVTSKGAPQSTITASDIPVTKGEE